MQVTDTAAIHYQTHHAGEIQDGLTVFCNQGASVLEMVVYRGEYETNQFGVRIPYDLYEIRISKKPNGFGLDLTELSQFQDLSKADLQYGLTGQEFYSTAQSAHARIGMLIAEHNGF